MSPFDDDIRTPYARQEFKTPGAAETLALVSDRCGLGPQSVVLEVACGTGEAACVLTERHGCRVLGLDIHGPSIRFAAAKARHRRLRRLVGFAWSDGRRLPVPDGRFDVALCMGSPAIVGLPEAWRELQRAVRPGGVAVVSDAVVAQQPPKAVRGRWPPWAATTLSFRAYCRGLEEQGLLVEVAELLPPSVWEEYHAPMLGLIEEVRRYRTWDGEAQVWADRMEAVLLAEEAALPYLAYAHFLARRTK